MTRVSASLLSAVMFSTLAAILLAQAPNQRDEARRELDAFQRSGHFAVLVGINQYSVEAFPTLQFAVHDADEMEQALKRQSPNYVVDRIEDNKAVYSAVKKRLTEAAELAKSDATLLFFFAGHGGQANGKQYLATYETAPDELADRGLALDEVESIMKRSSARRKILMIDACRADPGSAATRGVSIPVERFGFLQQSEGLQIFNATGANRPSYEDPELKHGVFTHFLISGLEGGAADGNGLVTFNQLTNYVIKGVSSFTYEKHRWETQKPYITSDDVSGDFLLGGKLTAAPPPDRTAVAGPQPVDVLQDAFERAEKAPNRLEMLRAFLTLFPLNRLAPLAEFDVAEADPAPATAYSNLGLKYLDQGEHPLAIEAFDKVLRLDPGNGAAAGYYALELSFDLALGEAIREAGNALRKQPGNIPALLGRGMAYNRVGETAKGGADLRQVVSFSPNDARGFEFRGAAHYSLGEYDLAIADFTQAISLRAGYGVPYNDRANAYSDRKEYVKALSDYSEALRLLPLNAVIWTNRGMTNAVAGHSDAAFADLAEALRLRPDYSMAYMGRGQVYSDAGRFEEAVRDFSSALRQTGFSYAVAVREMRGVAYLGWKKYSEAASDFTEALRADPNNAWLFEQRASARDALNDQAGAAADRAAAARLKKP